MGDHGEQVQELRKSSNKPGFSTGRNSHKADFTSNNPGLCVSHKLMTRAEKHQLPEGLLEIFFPIAKPVFMAEIPQL